MNELEIRSLISKEIRKQVNVFLFGTAAGATEQSETINELAPGMSGIGVRPVMHPYGFCSKAPDGTISVVARAGDHPGNRMVVGHRAADRPTDLNSGEAVLYDAFGEAIYVRKKKIQVGTKNSENPMVLGDVLVDMLTTLLNDILNAAQIGQTPFGPCFLDPTLRTQIQNIVQTYLTNSSTNIVSQLSFTERGGS